MANESGKERANFFEGCRFESGFEFVFLRNSNFENEVPFLHLMLVLVNRPPPLPLPPSTAKSPTTQWSGCILQPLHCARTKREHCHVGRFFWTGRPILRKSQVPETSDGSWRERLGGSFVGWSIEPRAQKRTMTIAREYRASLALAAAGRRNGAQQQSKRAAACHFHKCLARTSCATIGRSMRGDAGCGSVTMKPGLTAPNF